MEKFDYSQRRVCRALKQPRSTQRYEPKIPQRDAELAEAIYEIAMEKIKFGYRKVYDLLLQKGWQVNIKRVHRIWKQLSLQIPLKTCKKKLKRDPTNACHVNKTLGMNHVWSYDFVCDKLQSGGKIRFLNIVDEFTREAIAVEVGRHFKAADVIDVLRMQFAIRGQPCYIRSDNGPEFISKAVNNWLAENYVGTIFVEPGSPWQNGYIESFNGKFRNECLSTELFVSLADARFVVDRWREDYNYRRTHMGTEDHLPPAKFAAGCRDFAREWLGFDISYFDMDPKTYSPPSETEVENVIGQYVSEKLKSPALCG